MKAIILLFVMAVSSSSSEVEKAFTENAIVPDTLSIAPKKIVNVSFD